MVDVLGVVFVGFVDGNGCRFSFGVDFFLFDI